MKRTAISLVALAAGFQLTALGAAAATSAPNDYFFTQRDQWALTGVPGSINAPGAWAIATGYGVTVADVDTGANFAHPDLAGKLIPGARYTSCNSQNYGTPAQAPPDATGQDAVEDDVGHGSMTTGIVAADTNNGQGIAAVAPDARVLVVKVLSRTVQPNPITGQTAPTGTGCDSDVAAGIYWAAAHGASVINLSIGSEIPLTGSIGTVIQAIRDVSAQGVAVAVAAGNNQLPVSDYQQISNVALVVGANGPNGQTASYSTSGVGVNLYAPGGDSSQSNDIHGLVVSTNWPDPQYVNSDYAIGEGTSFAAPHAAGVLALLRSCGMSASAARSHLLAVANQRNQNLDAAATLAGQQHCAAPVGPPSSGGASAGNPARSAGTGASSGRRSPSGGGVPAGSTKPGSISAPTQPSGATSNATLAVPEAKAGSAPPPAMSTAGGSSGGGPLLLIVIGIVTLLGAPTAAWIVRALRRPGFR